MVQKKIPKLNIRLVPILFLIVIYPLVMRMTILETGLGGDVHVPDVMSSHADFFMYYKSMALIAVAILMIVLLLDQKLIRGDKLLWDKMLIWLLAYEALVVLSAVCSKYPFQSFHGMMEQYESMWVLLSYGMIAYYCACTIQKQDFPCLAKAVTIATFIQGLIGVTQFIGFDLLNLTLSRMLIVPAKYAQYRDALTFVAGEDSAQKVYGTLYQSNYAGVYFLMAMPILLGSFIYLREKKAHKKSMFVILTLCMDVICIVGTGSKSAVLVMLLMAVVSVIVVFIGAPAFRKQMLFGILGLIVLFFLADILGGQKLVKRTMDGFSQKDDTAYALENIAVCGDRIEITYRGKTIQAYYEEEGISLYPRFFDQSGKPLEYIVDEGNQTLELADANYEGLTFGCYRKNDIPYLIMNYADFSWRFTTYTEDGKFAYINIWGKPDTIEKADVVLFAGKEELFTKRGYIWGRSLPLCKNHLLFGSGPDTFFFVFPQSDYVEKQALGTEFFSQILTRPHSLYLQIAIQTGLCSLIGLAGFWGTIFVSLVHRYKQNVIKIREEKLVLVTVLSSISVFLLMGITNDSMVVTAPYFWMLLGYGIHIKKESY